MKSGPRNRLITIQRATVVTDDFGGETPTWAAWTTAWAEVLFGTGSERREAAQEYGSAAATFRVLHNTKTAAVKVTDRIVFDGSNWDVVGNVPSRALNDGREITAIRAAA
jgi:SPP1 family predicted phage head-tail adaptor